MKRFQEYQEDLTRVAEWLPWAAMPLAGVVENKDHSFLGAFSYPCDAVFDRACLCRELQALGSGWGLWCENRDGRRYAAFSWLPQAPGDDDAGHFDRVLARLAEQLPLRRLYAGELLQYLFESIATKKEMAFPAIPMYLDALLSLGQTYKLKPQEIHVDGLQVTVIVLNGFLEECVGRLYAFLSEKTIPFRSVRRFLLLTEAEAAEEANRYMAGWCKNRKTIAPLLAYEDNPQKPCGFYAHLLVHWCSERAALVQQSGEIKKFLLEQGLLAHSEHLQPELWFAAVPGNFRAYLVAPMLQIDDVSILFGGETGADPV
ncbi:MAG TPA: hypothetical protein PKA28_04390 [Methylomusa anaerophila]|uniref:Uncharacterized protein n=1 Tax=Methylomusa anaerophila TaxID=1930071 RepID=A0A348AN34_9FIRM|nr:hypothetical protein [Methylomusa anaerophila]BBB92482.1 hypothetical protein MAMMFC1_03175 [Methylomusa anaerophila]HML87666.1 hypothetical protein [Methylomusa anaerophila]